SGDYTLSVTPLAPSATPILATVAPTALSDFSLDNDITFQVDFTKAGVATSVDVIVSKDATEGLATLADLMQAITDALTAAGIEDSIEVTSQAGKLVFQANTDLITQLSLTFNSSADAAKLGYTSSALATATALTPYIPLEGNFGFVGV